jgi:hypothetical protein
MAEKVEAPGTGTEVDTSNMGGTAKNVARDTGLLALVIGMLGTAIVLVYRGAQAIGVADDAASGVEVDLS